MSACKGCNNRLRKPVGLSGFCDPCYLIVKLERLVFTRCPPHSVDELVQYLKKINETVESACEKFEADRTAGYVDLHGAPVSATEGDKRAVYKRGRAGPGPFEEGVHKGGKDKEAAPSQIPVKKEKDTESSKEPLVEPKEEAPRKKDRSRRRRRSRTRSHRSRSRRRSKKEDKKEKRGTPSPEAKKEASPISSSKAEEEEVEETFEEPESSPEVVKNDKESDRKYLLSRTANPSARKPLPRRPRTPSHSPPGYHDQDHRDEHKPKRERIQTRPSRPVLRTPRLRPW